MSCTNMHKTNLGSQLRIFNTGSFGLARLTRTNHSNELTQTPQNDPLE